MGHPLGRLALLHPFPSALVATLTGLLAAIAGAAMPVPLVLAGAMLGFQMSIGALNDVVDAPIDARAKPWKPVAAGRIRPGAARGLAVAAMGLAVLASWLVSPLAGVLGLAGWGCGAAYDLWLKRRGLGWLAFAAAFPILLLYAWTGPTGALPPGWPALLPLAAIAGPTVHLANAMADLEGDRAAGVPVVADRDRRTLVILLSLLLTLTLGLAWLTLALVGPGPVPMAIATLASGSAIAGLAVTARGGPRAGILGWSLIAMGMAAFAVAWLAAAAATES